MAIRADWAGWRSAIPKSRGWPCGFPAPVGHKTREDVSLFASRGALLEEQQARVVAPRVRGISRIIAGTVVKPGRWHPFSHAQSRRHHGCELVTRTRTTLAIGVWRWPARGVPASRVLNTLTADERSRYFKKRHNRPSRWRARQHDRLAFASAKGGRHGWQA